MCSPNDDVPVNECHLQKTLLVYKQAKQPPAVHQTPDKACDVYFGIIVCGTLGDKLFVQFVRHLPGRVPYGWVSLHMANSRNEFYLIVC